MSSGRYMNVRVSDKDEVAELLISDEANNYNIPNASYVPGIRFIVRTKDGRSYSGHIYLQDLAEKLNEIKTVAGTKLFKECKIKT